MQKQRTKCQVYTRVMGYLRPVQFYNHGKKSEFYSRKYFNQEKSLNKEFENKYGKSILINDENNIGFISING